MNSLGTTWFFDHNNYYSPLGYIGYAGGFISNMNSWRLTTGQDLQSVSIYPNFIDTNINLKTNGGDIVCSYLSDVPTDILGANRGLMTTMGAYHDFVLLSNNVMPYRLYAPSHLAVVGASDSVIVSVANIGSNTVTSMRINWLVNGVQMPQYSWTGSLAPGDTTLPIKLGHFVPAPGNNDIVVYTSLPNGVADQAPQNDTIKTSTYGCDSLMIGTYTIGANGHFSTIDEAMIRLKYCGVSGPVTLALFPGVYIENIIFEDTIRGTDSINTVTFTSTTGINSDVIIYTAKDSAQDIGTIDLKNVKHLIFSNIAIYGQQRSPMYYSKSIILRSGTENIEFKNCTLLIPTFVSATNIPGQLSVVYNPSGNQINNIRILNCYIHGGSAGIYLAGNGENILIKNNNIKNVDNYGIYMYYNNFTEISNNSIEQRYNTNLTLIDFTAMYFYQSNGNFIRNNKIHLYQTYYGMYMYYASKLDYSHLLVYNNEIIAPVTNNYYGIYMSTGCSDVKLLHNSVLIKGKGMGRCLYVTTTLSGNVLRNNNFINLSGDVSSIDNHVVYFPTTTATAGYTMDYNNYYTTGAYLGYAGNNITNLTLWRTAIGQDANSTSINPTFFSNQTLDIVDYTGLSCPRISDVPIDIDSNIRTTNTTVGAYHGDPYALDVMPRSIVSPAPVSSIGAVTPVTVTVLNVGSDTVTQMRVHWVINGITQPSYTWTGILLPNTTTSPITLGSFYPQPGYNSIMVYTSMPNGQADNLPANDTLIYETYGCDSGFSGTYTVGLIGADFSSLSEAVEALSYCGIYGPTTIAIQPGTYRGNVIIPKIPGTSNINTVTFTSAMQDSTTVVLEANLATGVIILDNTDNIIISHLTLEGILSGSASRCIEFKNSNKDILITNNFMETCLSNSASSAIMAIYSSQSQDTNVCIQNNHLYGTGGIWIESANYASSASYNITIENNLIEQFYYYGIYMTHSGITKVHNNKLRKSSETQQGYGIYMYYCYGVVEEITKITSNSIVGPFSYNAYLYYSYSNCGVSTANILFANNELIQTGSSGSYMLYQYYGGNWQNINNSFINTGTVTYQVYKYSTTPSSINFSNNIFANLNSCTYLFYCANTTANYIGTVDYNNYWKGNSTNLAYWGTAYSDLASWKSAHTNINAHSVAINPRFLDSTQKAVPSVWLGLECLANPLVTNDISGIDRSHSTHMGCYVPIYNLDAGLKYFVSPSGNSAISQTNVIVKLTNWGYNILQNATIQWKVNNTLQTPINLTNLSLAQYRDTNILLGSYLPVLGATTDLVAWVENPNNGTDENKFNDTVKTSSLGCNRILKGNYTVGGATADFASISQVFLELTTCGIEGNVNFLLENGTYNEAFIFSDPIPGKTDKDTITFTSLSGNADSVIIRTNGVVVTLGNVNDLIFKNLTIDASTGTYGFVFRFPCENIEINNCIIKLSPTSSSYAGIYKANATGTVNNIRILNNTISGGAYNIYLYGGTSTSEYANNITINNNTLSDAYQYGMYLYYSKFSSISNNKITSRTTSSASTYYGIYAYYSNANKINANKIYIPTTISSPYGMYFYYINYHNASGAGLITNNELIINASSSNGHGMYIMNSRLNIYHNSIHVNATAASKGLYISTSTNYPIAVRQNNIGSFSSMVFPIYLSSLNGLTLNYNNYYGSYIGYVNSGVSNMALWRMSTGQDVNSTNVTPTFIDITSNLKTDGFGLTCNRNKDVLYDIEDSIRGVITTVGAYNDFIMLPYNIMPKELVSPALSVSSGVSDSIFITIANMGSNKITSMNIRWQLNNGVTQTLPWTGNLDVMEITPPIFLGTFVPFPGSNTILIYTDSPNGQPDNDTSNDTMFVEVYGCDSALVGNYTVGGASANFASVTDAIKALSYCGMSGPTTILIQAGTYIENITIPYISGNSSTNILTITSANRDSSSVVIQSNSDEAAITLSSAKNVIIENLTINGVLTGNFSHAIDLKNNNRNIYIRNNRIQTSTDTCSTEAITAIYAMNSLDTSLFISNNYIHGSGGIWMQSANTNSASYDVSISNNIIDQFSYYGIYTSYVNLRTIADNKLYKGNINSNGYGMYVNYSYGISSDITRIVNNTIIGESFTALAHLNYCFSNQGTSISDILFANNELINTGISYYMVYQYYGGKWQNTNNTFLNTGSGTLSYLFYKYTTVSNGINFTNNMFINLGNCSYLIYNTTPTYTGVVDYNNYYTTGSNLVHWGNTYNSLNNWKYSHNTINNNSVSVDPTFANPTLNAIPVSWVGLVCPRNPDVLRDIKGVTRGQNTYMGCHVPSFTFDAGLESFITPSGSSIAGNSTPVSVRLSNSGTTVLNSVTIRWEVDGTNMTPVNVSGLSLSQFKDTIIYLGTYIPVNNTVSKIVAWIESPNGLTKDDNQANDTIDITSLGCTFVLNGSYTVGDSASDFGSLTEVFNILNTCGVSGPVTLQLRPGTYGNLTINRSFVNSSNINTVTITSATGRASDVVFQSTGNVVTLGNTSHYIFSNVSIDATSGTKAVMFNSACENIEISNCIIKAHPTTTSSTYTGIYKAGSGVVNNIRILNNHIDGGYYNIYFYGGVSSTDYGTNITIDGNTLTNAYYYGMYFYYSDFNSVSYNTITPRNISAATYYYGIYFYYCNASAVDGNKIHSKNVAITYPYGIYANYFNYNNTNTAGIISNNDIILNATSTTAGLYLNYGRVNIINNSVYINGTGGNRIVYINPESGHHVSIKNNNFISMSTTGYGVYIANTANLGSTMFMDYNNYYAAYIGYASGNINNLSTWQMSTGQDVHSVTMYPKFIDETNDLKLLDYVGLLCPRDTNVLTDLDKKERTSLTIIGAYSVALYEDYDLSAAFLVEPINIPGSCYPDLPSIKVAISNNGIYPFNFALNQLKLHVEITGAYNFKADTTISSGTLKEMQQDTFEIASLIPMGANGDYHITVWLSCPIDTIHSDDTLRYTYRVNKISLPFDLDFSTIPSEIKLNQLTGDLNWEIAPGDEDNPPLSPVFGTGRLRFASSTGKGSMAQVITEPIDMQGTYSPKLEFWYAHDNLASDARDQTNFYISIDGGYTFISLINVFRYDSAFTTPGWKYYQVDLSAYASYSCVIFSIEAQSYGGGNQNIDRIRISAAPDIKIGKIDVPNLKNCDLTHKTVKILVENNTSQRFNFVYNPTNLSVKLTNPDGVSQNFSIPLNSKELNGNEIDTIILGSTFDFSTTGTYTIHAFINSVDSNRTNDTLKRDIWIYPDAAITYVRDVDAKNVGDTMYASAWVKNVGSPMLSEVPLRLQINNANDIYETVYANLNTGDSIYYTFKQGYIVPTAHTIQPYYQLAISTNLDCDVNPTNNRRAVNGKVNVIDVAITNIEKPTADDCDTGLHRINVKVELTNNGDSDVVGVRINVDIDSGGVVFKQLGRTVTVHAGMVEVFEFSTQYIVPNIKDSNERYTVKAYINAVPGDDSREDDTLEVKACVVYNPGFSIHESLLDKFYLGQNQPNPAMTSTVIPYSVPQPDEVVFKIVSIKGQVLYQEVLQAHIGENEINIPTEFLANGIYYYSVGYKGKTIVKKMTIQK